MSKNGGDAAIKSSKTSSQKLSKIEQEVLRDIEKIFGIKVYFGKEELKRDLKNKEQLTRR